MRRPARPSRTVRPGLAWAAALALGGACAGVRPWAGDESHRIAEVMQGAPFDAGGREAEGIAFAPAPPRAGEPAADRRPPEHRRRSKRIRLPRR